MNSYKPPVLSRGTQSRAAVGTRQATILFALSAATMLCTAVGGAQVASGGSAPVAGQAASRISPALAGAVTRARALVDQGNGADARFILDSLVKASPLASFDLAEALYWRATLAEQIGDAERDWKRLVIEAPLSPRTPDALLRLGELDLLRGHPAEARPYFERVIREFPDSARIARGTIWLVRSYFDERNMPGGCEALKGLASVHVPEGELKLQADELKRRCDSVVTGSSAVGLTGASDVTGASAAGKGTDAATSATGGSTGSKASSGTAFSVQLAAFNTRAEAQSLVARLKKKGVDARVDGTVKPFRVRTGRYGSRAEADAALAKLKKQGHSGFIAEISK